MSGIKRFSNVIAEVENIEHQCEDCLNALSETDIVYKGMGQIASNLPYMYCDTCKVYYIIHEGIKNGYRNT